MKTEIRLAAVLGEAPRVTHVSLGVGALNWPRSERVSDRYGLVNLTNEHGAIVEPAEAEGVGRLVAVVKEARKSTHIGDFFRGLSPKTPKDGDCLELGHGRLFRQGNDIGLEPLKDRDNDWLNPRVLYNCHESVVELLWIPDGKGVK